MKNAFIHNGNGTVSIELSRGFTATIDACDVERVGFIRWCTATVKGSRTSYVKGRVPGGDVLLMHRLLLCFPLLSVDHINGNGLDNRRCNLRLASHSQNCRNLGVRNISKTSAFKGVQLIDGKKCKWEASIRFNGKLFYLGRFSSEVIASAAYDVASRRLHGEFGYRNNAISASPELEASVLARIERVLSAAKATA